MMTTYTTTTDRATARARLAETLETTGDDRPHTLDSLAGIGDGPVLVTVHRDGRVTVETDRADAPMLPDVYWHGSGDRDANDAQMHRDAAAYGWQLVTGFTGQYGYNGPAFHASEYIGGRLATHVLTYGADMWDIAGKCLHPFIGTGAYCQHQGDDGTCMWERDDHTPDAVATWWGAVVVSNVDDDDPDSWALAYRVAAPATSPALSQEV